MGMKVKESKFGAPPGIYLGKFLGISPFKGDGKPRLGRDGKPMGPAVEWQFEITEDSSHGGANVGQQVGRITQEQPTTKNSCGTLLSGLIGRTLVPDDDIEPGDYVGFVYQLVISPSKEDPERTYVTQIVRVPGGDKGGPSQSLQTAPPLPPRKAPTPPPPPPPPPRGTPTAPAQLTGDEPRYWVCSTEPNSAPFQMTAEELRRQLKDGLVKAGHYNLLDGKTNAWGPLEGSWLETDAKLPF